MRLRRISALVLAAAVATTMLTGCPWDKEEEPGSSSSSSSSSSSRPSYDDGNEDDGRPDKPNRPDRPDRPDKPEEPEEPEEPEIPEGGYEVDEATGAYTVYTEEGLRAWAEADSDGKVSCTLAMDIALSGGWEPTGSNAGYSAVFDGQGHTISGLDQAFFAIIYGGTVRNLHLNVDIVNTDITGGIAGRNDGSIENCTVSGTIQSELSEYTGGIAGINASSIKGCIVSADVKGGRGNAAGGIAGLTTGAQITACCFVDGNVEGEYIGGIAGAVAGGTVTACYWSGSPEQAAGGGQGEIVSGEKVDGTTITWETAVDAMNAQLTGCEYEFVLGSDGKPELVQKGSAEQAAAQLLKRFKK